MAASRRYFTPLPLRAFLTLLFNRLYSDFGLRISERRLAWEWVAVENFIKNAGDLLCPFSA